MDMGIGALGAPGIIIKRKFRWTFAIEQPYAVPGFYVKVGARPKLDIEQTDIHYLNAVMPIPGKGKWQPLTITWRDVPAMAMQGLWSWICNVYDFNKGIQKVPQSEKAGWAGRAILKLYDGCGKDLETWEINNMWPQSVDWGDLDYASSEDVTMTVTFAFCDVRYTGNCGPTPQGNCLGC